MSRFRVQPQALAAVEDIHRYSIGRWGEERADAYILGLFDVFERIAERGVPWRSIPAEFGIAGYRHRYHRHFVYWRGSANGAVIIFAVLHEKMTQVENLETLGFDAVDAIEH